MRVSYAPPGFGTTSRTGTLVALAVYVARSRVRRGEAADPRACEPRLGPAGNQSTDDVRRRSKPIGLVTHVSVP